MHNKGYHFNHFQVYSSVLISIVTLLYALHFYNWDVIAAAYLLLTLCRKSF